MPRAVLARLLLATLIAAPAPVLAGQVLPTAEGACASVCVRPLMRPDDGLVRTGLGLRLPEGMVRSAPPRRPADLAERVARSAPLDGAEMDAATLAPPPRPEGLQATTP